MTASPSQQPQPAQLKLERPEIEDEQQQQHQHQQPQDESIVSMSGANQMSSLEEAGQKSETKFENSSGEDGEVDQAGDKLMIEQEQDSNMQECIEANEQRAQDDNSDLDQSQQVS